MTNPYTTFDNSSHFAVAECGDPEVAEQYLPIIHLVFANLKDVADRYPPRR